MKLHPRELITKQASLDITRAVGAAALKHNLTFIEVTQILASEIQYCAKYALRAERHPEDPSRAAGLE